MKFAIVFCIATLTLTAASSVQGAANTADQCRKLYRLTDLNLAIEPGVLIPASDTAVAHCRVRGVVNRAIRFEVTLPIDNWNGRMMFSTVGGGAGTIGDTTSLLSDGYAMASTDTGHEISEGNAYYRQPQALLDYAFRGVHLATLTAKRVIREYYARDIDYAYLKGCSNGGRAAMLEAVRFPEDYDGIIAGAPAFQFLEMISWMVGAHRAQSANPLTTEALNILDRASRLACDGLDGIDDGVIGDPRKCTSDVFDIDKLVCQGGQVKDCLTPGQIKTARYVYEDVVDSNGVRLSPGVLPGAEAAGDWGFWMLPNDQFEDQSVISGIGEMLSLLMRHEPDFNLDEFDPATDRAAIVNATSPLDVRSADLTEFKNRGGKLLMYQGWNDWPLRPQRAIDFLAKVESATGGARMTRDFYRLFMVPGMVHCAGGPGAWQADYVKPLVSWREKDQAPERIVATHPDSTPLAHLVPNETAAPSGRFTRPLCVYPKLAEYSGRGDEDDAANFRCVKP